MKDGYCIDVHAPKVIRERKLAVRKRKHEILTDYNRIMTEWKATLPPGDDDDDSRADEKKEVSSVGGRFPTRMASGDRPTRATSREFVRSDYEQEQLLKEIMDREKFQKRIELGAAQVPEMILGVRNIWGNKVGVCDHGLGTHSSPCHCIVCLNVPSD